jgi:hypothetical protein
MLREKKEKKRETNGRQTERQATENLQKKEKNMRKKKNITKILTSFSFFSLFLFSTSELRGLIFRVMFDRDRFFIVLKKKKYK